ncbi:MAG TPA: alpha/beta hydrolase [Verrucomicrobiae bacterium]|nr:alpha/beta hydrolase [Verrucomicrobiae bacterium]
MKRAVILHGTDANPEANWFPWLRDKLETNGYQVWVPQLLNAHTPNRELWDHQILGGRELTDCIVVGHSAGAVEVLSLLMNPRCPRIRLGVMVSAWPDGMPVGEWETGQFDNLFPAEGFNLQIIKARADRLAFLHGAKDPYCPLATTMRLAEQLGAPITVVANAEHFSGVTALPELWKIIEPYL